MHTRSFFGIEKYGGYNTQQSIEIKTFWPLSTFLSSVQLLDIQEKSLKLYNQHFLPIFLKNKIRVIRRFPLLDILIYAGNIIIYNPMGLYNIITYGV
jgi:hypothetical protein